ncbi:bifunctional acetaldehyde-CoA/alcohol dehydrogenase [Thiospirochaeta perfilievii]|uniref:Aldehyde-alcohol dehydrogenase n=1 Tax=Thiospirochaeta perfilievii TaxID=252967 RepID=A0A5C1QDL7_9SPIO|nr:bifunctional acetaldehyde-CoA/alcohol dehydrogenase [Thiospirochaeta perfilievii]QEN05458.1 bifunctional acetaldehyde-CoA/alcohol dehydrogenase [Thiospirochaeta perfilievii]
MEQKKKATMSIGELDSVLERVSASQKLYSNYDQSQVDEIFRVASIRANENRISLAKAAATETGMGIMEDKVIKNHFASEFIFHQYKDAKTCGIIEEDKAYGIKKIAEPYGVICAIIPTTNPTSTAIFKCLIALKTRNAVVISPHPRAKNATIEAARIIRDAAVEAGAPKDLIGWVTEPSMELSNHLMTHPKINLILATGGPGMVKAAYSSGKPAIGVGAGNTPAVIDESADLKTAVSSILLSKTFDNGVICASEQSVIAHKDVYKAVKDEFKARGAHILSKDEKEKVGKLILNEKGMINPAIVGQSAFTIAKLAGFDVDPKAKVLIGEVSKTDVSEPFAHEKLSPILALYSGKDFDEILDKGRLLIELGGFGHTSVLYTDLRNQDRINEFGHIMKTGRVLINTPASQGAIGDLYNFKLAPSLTLGCGSWGGNSVSENVGIKHLLNIKTIAERRENMLWFKIPPKIYHKPGCMPLALTELKGKKRAFIVTDVALYKLGYVEQVTSVLEEMNIDCEVFFDVEPDPTMSMVNKGLERINSFKPDTIVALGGGSPMDAAKIMWLLYEHPEVKFEGLALRFMDIEKRIYSFPEMGKKANMVAIPTTSGTGSEVTPFAVVTDDKTGMKYPIADYALTPNIAIIDSQLVESMPKGLTAASGIDAVTHSLEAFASIMSTDYTNGIALESLRLLFKYLPDAYKNGAEDKKARERVHNASAMAGMAFSNAFLGICHSLAHKLGAAFHIPHGIANAILINHVIKFNATDVPTKQGVFSQYTHPTAKSRYAKIANYLDLGGKDKDEKIANLLEAITSLKNKLDIPKSIKECGVSEEEFLKRVDTLSEEAFDDQCTGANPRFPLISELKQIYLDAYYGL